MKEVLCKSCLCWIDCDPKGRKGKPYGFCLCRDLFSYTAETECKDYVNGTPSTDKEWEDYQNGKR